MPYALQRLRETLVVSEATAKTMRANRGQDTGPEVALRRALWAAGLRGYRKNVRKLPGRPDVVFGPAKVAVFVHGCFWHGCPTCARNLKPKLNANYWDAKREQSTARDARNRAALADLGYHVLVVWECELASDASAALKRVQEALERQGAGRVPQSDPGAPVNEPASAEGCEAEVQVR